ncbi:GrpE-like protein, mitochondrial [Cryptotermes secundus]|uniref:GrpE-like protein, mitochondrial n=1 Tax=Cryptotermes secundus TaxID=105785 RepID=A0A2J7QIT5_9NEOP|nr:GrpE-like protein, mitochondrial [Cryptotermes secundus]
MALVGAALLRFGRLVAENVVSVGKYGSTRCQSNTSFLSRWPNGQRGMSVTSEETKQNAETAASEESENEKKIRKENENLIKEIDLLSEKNLELEDKYKRALADGENMRRRLMKQIEDAKLFGIQGFCKDLLEVADILGKATESVPKEEVRESNPHLKNLYEGLKMTEAQLHKVFSRHGLIPVNPIEEKFDPNLHEALFQQVR